MMTKKRWVYVGTQTAHDGNMRGGFPGSAGPFVLFLLPPFAFYSPSPFIPPNALLFLKRSEFPNAPIP
jgi:hypothetical protein